MINSTKQRYVFAIDGAVAPANTSAEKLAKGQFMIGDVSKPGIQAVGDMTLIRKDQKRLKLMVGEDKRTRSRSFTHGASETKVFSLSQVQEIRVTYPKVLKP